MGRNSLLSSESEKNTLPSPWCPEMTSTSQDTFASHEEASQSLRLRSTSSTNWYLSAGRKRRKACFSSAELMVIVHTVCFPASASGGRRQAANRQSERARRMAFGPHTEMRHEWFAA